MNFSTFLFFLLFPLATTVDFEIINKQGVHIYEISEDWNKNPEYVYTQFISKYDPHLLDTSNTYVILHINSHNQFYLYYWIEKRINAAHSAGNVFKIEILLKLPGVYLKAFHRESEGAETSKFRTLFKLANFTDRMSMRLYRVAGSRGQFVMEVPLIYNELNGSDSFVLEKYGRVFLWNSFHSNIHKRHQAGVLGNRILEYDKNKKYDGTNFFWLTEGDRNISPDFYDFFIKEFLMDLEGVAESRQFPQNQVNYSDIELDNKMREKLNLLVYEYDWILNRVIERKVEWKVLLLKNFHKFRTYLLVDFHNGNVYPILGKEAGIAQIKIALSAAEKHFRRIGVENAWKKVKIIRMSVYLPTYFIIYLQDGVFQL